MTPPNNSKPESVARLGGNIRASLAYQIVGVAFSFVALPIVIAALGAEAYGLWSLVGAIFAFLGFAELMFSSTAVRFIAEARGRNAPNEVRQIYDVLWIVGILWGFLLAAICVWASSWLIDQFFNIPDAQLEIAKFVLWCHVLTLPFRMALTVDAGAIQGSQRLDISYSIGMGYVIVHSLGMVVAVSIGGGLRELAIWEVISFVLSSAVHLVVARGLLPKREGSLRIQYWITKMAPFASRLLLGYIGGALLLPASRLLLGVFRPLAEVGYFSLAVKLASEVRAGASHIATATMPAASDLAGRKDPEALTQLLTQASRWTLMVLVPIATLAAMLGGTFITFWVNPEFGEACTSLLMVLVPALCLVFLNSLPGSISQGLGRPGPWALANLTALGINVLVGSWWIREMGAMGAAVTLVLAGLLSTVPFWVWLSRQLELSAEQWTQAFPSSVFVLGILLGGLAWLANAQIQHLWQVFVTGILGMLLYGWVLSRWVCTPMEQEAIRGYFQRFKGKGR